MAENPQNIIRSWNVQTNFAGGPVTSNRLVPPKYGRIKYNYVKTWREISAGVGDLDWSSKNYSFYIPSGVRVLAAMYLRIQLPALSGAVYKSYPGLYPIKEIRIVSGGSEVYPAPYTEFLADHMQSQGVKPISLIAKIRTVVGQFQIVTGAVNRVEKEPPADLIGEFLLRNVNAFVGKAGFQILF